MRSLWINIAKALGVLNIISYLVFGIAYGFVMYRFEKLDLQSSMMPLALGIFSALVIGYLPSRVVVLVYKFPEKIKVSHWSEQGKSGYIYATLFCMLLGQVVFWFLFIPKLVKYYQKFSS